MTLKDTLNSTIGGTRNSYLQVVPILILVMVVGVPSNRLTSKGYPLASLEDFQFDALPCDEAKTLGRYSARSFCDVEHI